MRRPSQGGLSLFHPGVHMAVRFCVLGRRFAIPSAPSPRLWRWRWRAGLAVPRPWPSYPACRLSRWRTSTTGNGSENRVRPSRCAVASTGQCHFRTDRRSKGPVKFHAGFDCETTKAAVTDQQRPTAALSATAKANVSAVDSSYRSRRTIVARISSIDVSSSTRSPSATSRPPRDQRVPGGTTNPALRIQTGDEKGRPAASPFPCR
jgi:hypothetical protein